MKKIFVIDDEENICELIKYNLEKENFIVDVSYDGNIGFNTVVKGDYDLLILDVMLPGMSGMDVCKRLRDNDATKNLPIIMLSARGEEIDKVIGLEYGADDYMVKPFSPRELTARIKAVLRRSIETNKDNNSEGIIRRGNIEINLLTREVLVRNVLTDFTPKEYALLELLIQNEGQAFSREFLLEKVWGYDYPGDTRTVDVHVRHIRQKIEDNPADPMFLQTVRSYGYRYKGN